MKDNFSKSLGEWLAEKRKSKHLTQLQASELMGCSSTRIANWEQGTRDMSAKELVRYCEAIGIDLNELVRIFK